MSDVTCKTCAYWQQGTDVTKNDPVPNRFNAFGQTSGVCRRVFPTAFALTQEEDWCAEYKSMGKP